MSGKIAVLIDASLHNELVLRTRSTKDVTSYIEHALESFLDRTADDAALWSPEYLEELDAAREDDGLTRYGDPAQGYHWQAVFLPNGTRLRITYKGRTHFAEIRHRKLMDGDDSLTPSEWARRVANNTNRNAWRDIWVTRPGDKDWQYADLLRRQQQEGVL